MRLFRARVVVMMDVKMMSLMSVMMIMISYNGVDGDKENQSLDDQKKLCLMHFLVGRWNSRQEGIWDTSA